MGQYYMPYIKSLSEQEERSVNAHNFDCGLKITEHSWIGNYMCNQVYNWILDNPSIVVWLGDYAEFEMVKNETFKDKKLFNRVKSIIWGGQFNEILRKPNELLMNFNFNEKWFLVNETKKQFLDIKEFILKCGDMEWGCLSPLSLLTAVGNGEGGGDYWGRNQDKVGIWAFDVIQITQNKPKGYEEIFVEFIESWIEKERA